MAGIEGGRKIQLGAESVAGTAVAATAIWRGKGLPEDAREVQFVDEDTGYVSGVDRTITPRLLGKFTFDPTPATFEQLPYIGAAGIKNVVSGAADGVGSGKVYAYPMPTTAPTSNVLKTFTLEGGDDNAAEEIEYSFVESFKLTGKPGEPLMASANWVGRQVTPTTFTPALSLPSVESVLFSKGKLWIDSTTIGTTQKSGTLMGMELAVKTGWIIVETGDSGQLYFYTIKHVREEMEVILNITFEHDGVATAEKAAWRAETARLIRLQFEGSALTTPGTSFSKKTLRLDLAGKWEKFEKLGSQKGNDVIAGVLRARFVSAASLFATMTVVNELSSLP